MLRNFRRRLYTISMIVSIGIIVFNEEKNIVYLLDSLLKQKLKKVKIGEIIVVSSGSVDQTNDIVKKFSEKHKNIRLVTQKKRQGKASAVNLFLKSAQNHFVIIMSGDLVLKPDTVEQLVTPLHHSTVGIVGSHPVPVNDPNTFMGYAAHFMWDLHHLISLKKPKMGEMIAFRKIFQKIPVLSAVDEANIEPLIRGQGYKAVYAPQAIVFNKGPETVSEFITRRRHIAYGHHCVKKEYSYEVSTSSSLNIIFMLLKNIKLSWRFFLWTPAVMALELYGRILGYMDYKLKLKQHTIWQITPSTKQVIPIGKQND